MALKRSTCNQSQDDVYISKRSKAASVEITCKPVQKDLSCFCQAKSMRQAGEVFVHVLSSAFGFTLITAVSEFQQNISV